MLDKQYKHRTPGDLVKDKKTDHHSQAHTTSKIPKVQIKYASEIQHQSEEKDNKSRRINIRRNANFSPEAAETKRE